MTRRQKLSQHIETVWRIRSAPDDLLLVTAGTEVFVLAFLCLFSRRRIVVFDFLCPRNWLVQRIGRLLLWRVDKWLVIRRGDVDTLSRLFSVDASRCEFVPFPAEGPAGMPNLGGYIYAAGRAHRDWTTFLAAMDGLTAEVIVTSDPLLKSTPANVNARELASPEVGKALAAGARLVVVPFADTYLPSGPLVVVDAMAAGKVVVASDVNGSRDYIEHVNGW